MTVVTKKTPHWPVVEVFGPTIQGEGVDQGVAAAFVRFGGCDYRCTWCDTPHAVIPTEVRKNYQNMTASEVGVRVNELEGFTPIPWVILTGGNPALHDLSDLVKELHRLGYLVAVETQGSRWREWMGEVDRLCVSPKPPSAKESKASDLGPLDRFLHEAMLAKAFGSRPYEWMFLKVVIFDEADLDYAEKIRSQFSDALLYLSAGNDAGRTVGNPTRVDTRTVDEVRVDLCERYVWLVDHVLERPALCLPSVSCQLQSHVLAWGNAIGH